MISKYVWPTPRICSLCCEFTPIAIRPSTPEAVPGRKVALGLRRSTRRLAPNTKKDNPNRRPPPHPHQPRRYNNRASSTTTALNTAASPSTSTPASHSPPDPKTRIPNGGPSCVSGSGRFAQIVAASTATPAHVAQIATP